MSCIQLLCCQNFIKITSLEKKIKIIRVFSKQHGFASQDSLVVGRNGWGFCGVAGTLAASRGGGVSDMVEKEHRRWS